MGKSLKILTAGMCVIGLVMAALADTSYAAYPDGKTVTIIVGYRAGGSSDTITRTYAPFLSRHLGVPVIVKNMAGAGATIAMKHINKEAPDGYTLFNLTLPSYVNATLFRKITAYDPREFTIIQGAAGGDSNGFMVGYNSKFKSYKEVVEASQKEPIKISSTTPGSNSWILETLLKNHTGLKTQGVTFDSGREAMLALVGGHVDGGIVGSSNFPDMIREKQIRVLGVGSAKRLPYAPDVPTFTEQGYPDVQSVNRQLLVGPPGIPSDIKEVLVKAASKAFNDPEYIEMARKVGFDVEVPALTSEEALQEVINAHEQSVTILKAEGIIK
ncbi:MAG: tripartite tricarboxylate transporter substrate binding protein [Deltaproteobacteria bacterium]|nr:tripartite tricarboxylate transporter substrate binding protein [Deltaproteobacteria bacterium]